MVSPEKAAKAAGLRYVHDQMSGIRRQRRGKGFSYLLPSDGSTDSAERLPQNSQERDRIEALAIPPIWEDVWICLDPNGHLQATGRDPTPVKVIKCTTVDLRAFQRSVFKNQKFIPAVCFSF